jgi:hypothetical protein
MTAWWRQESVCGSLYCVKPGCTNPHHRADLDELPPW